MRLVTFVPSDGHARAGALLGTAIIDLAAAAPLVFEASALLRWDMLSLLQAHQDIGNLEALAEIQMAVIQQIGDDLAFADDRSGNGSDDYGMSGSLSIGGSEMVFPLEQVMLLAPLPRPASLRGFDAFEAHALTRYRSIGALLPSEWYHFPAFAFANHGAVYGPDAAIPSPASEACDYALELACVIGREGRDIAIEDASEFIAGYMIMNGWSARDIQAEELRLGRGPAKARDFATSLGPWLVTPDELEIYADDDGRLSLTMIARVNGVERSRGNAAGLSFTFAQMIAYASRDATLYPGDVLSSGSIGGGCLFDLTLGQGPWLQPGDQVELEITGLGKLRNEIG